MGKVKTVLFFLVLLLALSCRWEEQAKDDLVVATYIGDKNQIMPCLTLCQSIRNFGGTLHEIPILVYLPADMDSLREGLVKLFDGLSADIRTATLPEIAGKFGLGEKPFIAALAEKEAVKKYRLLCFLDPNSIVINTPAAWLLGDGYSIGVRPVIRRNIGSLVTEKPDSFWSQVYDILDVKEEEIFPMKTVADDVELRPYFNAGHVVVRPEKGIFREWARDFRLLASDPFINSLAQEGRYNVFLHQAALVGAVLNHAGRKEILILPASYNYPLFFEKLYPSTLAFDSINGVSCLKYEFDFNSLPDGWDKAIKGPTGVIEWIKIHTTENCD